MHIFTWCQSTNQKLHHRTSYLVQYSHTTPYSMIASMGVCRAYTIRYTKQNRWSDNSGTTVSFLIILRTERATIIRERGCNNIIQPAARWHGSMTHGHFSCITPCTPIEIRDREIALDIEIKIEIRYRDKKYSKYRYRYRYI